MASDTAMSAWEFTCEEKSLIANHPLTAYRVMSRSSLEMISLDSIEASINQFPGGHCCFLIGVILMTVPAANIRRTDSKPLSELGLEMVFNWSKSPHPIELYNLIGTAASEAPDMDVWVALVGLLRAFNSQVYVPSERSAGFVSPTNHQLSTLQLLRTSWKGEYYDSPIKVLNEVLQSANTRFPPYREEYYARILLFLQSSGMGKSRLVDKFGETCPMINFILRKKGTHGYPARDGEILSFLSREIEPKERDKILAPYETTPAPKGHSSRHVALGDIGMKYDLNDEDSMVLLCSSNADTTLADIDPFNERFHEHLVKAVWTHSRAAAFLQASLEQFAEWAKHPKRNDASLGLLATMRHQEMAPPAPSDWNTRSSARIGFCKSVVIRAEHISNGLIENRKWQHAFRDDSEPHVRLDLETSGAIYALRDAASKLVGNLRARSGTDKDPVLVVSLNSVYNLLTLEGHSGSGLYHALFRIVSCLKDLPIWFFMLSTVSVAGVLMPPTDEDLPGDCSAHKTARLAPSTAPRGSLRHCPLFLALPLDIEDRKRMVDPAASASELALPLNAFSTIRHMAMFGRPLWFGYKDEEIIKLAKSKLIGGLRRRHDYDGADMNHVFAALAFRLSLDVCLQNPRSLQLQRNAVDSHMRVVIAMEPETGLMETTSPSEPILSQAAQEYLCHEINWSRSLSTLTNKLLNQGLIEKGLQGELYARTLLILAQDSLYKQQLPQPIVTFSVKEFLEALYIKEHHFLLSELPRDIMSARINFNHFVPIKEDLKEEHIPDLLHDLLRRRAALQLAPRQPTYDILIPFYAGNPSEPFNPKNSGVLVVQVKNKSEATSTTSIFGEPFTISTGPHAGKTRKPGPKTHPLRDSQHANYFALRKVSVPVLFLLFDLGATPNPNGPAPAVEVLHSNRLNTTPVIWSVHSRGNDSSIFRCLMEMECGSVAAKFFNAITPRADAHDNLCQRNHTFLNCSRNARYESDQWDRTEKFETGSARARRSTVASTTRTSSGRKAGMAASKALGD